MRDGLVQCMARNLDARSRADGISRSAVCRAGGLSVYTVTRAMASGAARDTSLAGQARGHLEHRELLMDDVDLASPLGAGDLRCLMRYVAGGGGAMDDIERRSLEQLHGQRMAGWPSLPFMQSDYGAVFMTGLIDLASRQATPLALAHLAVTGLILLDQLEHLEAAHG